MKNGHYTYASLRILAAERPNNASIINLVGLAQSGIEQIPVA
jgi:hypothetical protein